MGASKVFFVPGVSQKRPWTRLGVDLARSRAPRAKHRFLGSMLGTILAQNIMFFRLRLFVPYADFMRCFVCSPSSFVALFMCLLAVREKKAERLNSIHPPSEHVFFKVHACAGFAARTTTDGQKRLQTLNGKKAHNHQKPEISGSRRRPPKKAPKMTSRRLPGTLREPPGRARRGPRAAKRAPRMPPQEPLRS